MSKKEASMSQVSKLAEELGVTHVDLGEDLLQKLDSPEAQEFKGVQVQDFEDPKTKVLDVHMMTRVSTQMYQAPVSKSEFKTPPGPRDWIQNALILKSEGLIAEAKKNLWKVLRVDSNHPQAKAILQEIQDQEISAIFQSEPRYSQVPVLPSEELPYQDKELKQGKKNFWELLEFQRLTSEDCLDLALGFYGMECFDLAQFAIQKGLLVSRDVDLAHLKSLRAWCLFKEGRYWEVLSELQALLRDQAQESLRLDQLYLAARSYKALGDINQSRLFYEAVRGIDAGYRDLGERNF